MNDGARFIWESAAESHTGNVREANEDSILDRRDRGLWAVADGMGGHFAGAEASRLVIDTLAAMMPPPANIEAYSKQVQQALHSANQSLVDQARRQGGGISGSTAAVFASVDGRASVIWVGDSRVYRFRNGTLVQLSRDHNQMEEWIAQGLLNKEEAEKYPPSNIITRAIGADELLEPDEVVLDIEPGDTFLICSDGLYNEVSDSEFAKLLTTGHCASAARQLLELTLQREARDNVSAIVVHARATVDAEARTLINPRVMFD